ncbi:nectin-3-like isoform X2 [Mugil cephalus]|uniref:nectin-3-like isoform X2 n=1 Tax=Mugil cephalus TaxID=48193 RepID=UPI001FB70784|nr:nectin-3-like isoform X2 [Mugil cephalus]
MDPCPFLLSIMGNFFLNRHFSVSCRLLLVLSVTLMSRNSEALQVIGGSATVVKGGTAILPCRLIETSETLTQITWQRRTREKPENYDFVTIQSDGPQYVNGPDNRFEFIGNFSDKNGSLQLSNVQLKDEGSYTCIFTLFPSGNHKTEIPLNLLDVMIIQRSEDSYECVANANPEAHFIWSRSDQSLPESGIKVQGATLQFVRKTSDLNGLYQCEAVNPYGRKRGGQLHVYMDFGSYIVGWILFGLLLSLNIVAVSVWYLRKHNKRQLQKGT